MIELAAGEIRHAQMIEKLQQVFRCLDEKWKPEELSQKLVETLLSFGFRRKGDTIYLKLENQGAMLKLGPIGAIFSWALFDIVELGGGDLRVMGVESCGGGVDVLGMPLLPPRCVLLLLTNSQLLLIPPSPVPLHPSAPVVIAPTTFCVWCVMGRGLLLCGSETEVMSVPATPPDMFCPSSQIFSSFPHLHLFRFLCPFVALLASDLLLHQYALTTSKLWSRSGVTGCFCSRNLHR